MLITVEPGADRHNLLQTLQQVIVKAENLTVSNGRALRIAYLDWVHTSRAQLRRQISSADLDRLVTTPRYVTVLSMQIPEPVWDSQPLPFGGSSSRPVINPDTTPVRDMILLEVAEHIEQLREAFETLSAWSNLLDQPERSGPLVIADSNVYCHHQNRLDTWEVGQDAGALLSQDVHLILPLAVLDELDRQKDRGQGVASTNARETIKLLDNLLPRGVVRQRGSAPENPAFPRGAITIDLWPDPPGHVRLPRTDDEIIARAVAFQALAGRKVKLLTGDLGMSTRARLAGIEAIRLVFPDATQKPKKEPRGTRHPALQQAAATTTTDKAAVAGTAGTAE
ncbi:PIN domain-containing protein [Nonomuraea sp. NPDC005650]|uniref:PIN domain-containing protein n=1 Tax=Nonomuraea sp. NPDC005650 TaxID=3157045 RepID=UPI0033B04422